MGSPGPPNPYERRFRGAIAAVETFRGSFPWSRPEVLELMAGTLSNHLSSGIWSAKRYEGSVSAGEVLADLWPGFVTEDCAEISDRDIWAPLPRGTAFGRPARVDVPALTWVNDYDTTGSLACVECPSMSYLLRRWRTGGPERLVKDRGTRLFSTLSELAEAMVEAVDGASAYAGPRPPSLFRDLSLWSLRLREAASALRSALLSRAASPADSSGERLVTDARHRLEILGKDPLCPSVVFDGPGLGPMVAVGTARFVRRTYDETPTDLLQTITRVQPSDVQASGVVSAASLVSEHVWGKVVETPAWKTPSTPEGAVERAAKLASELAVASSSASSLASVCSDLHDVCVENPSLAPKILWS